MLAISLNYFLLRFSSIIITRQQEKNEKDNNCIYSFESKVAASLAFFSSIYSRRRQIIGAIIVHTLFS